MRLDSRIWLIWGSAVSLPVLVSRNPFLLGELLVIVLVIRALSPAARDWSWLLRIVSLFVLISVVFNLLTVHSGDRVLGKLPDAWPIIGGAITWNALVYGVISGMAIFLLVLTWTLVAANLRWSVLMRQLPPRLAPLAVAGSVAWSYLPRMHDTLQEIRESQRSRGWQPGRLHELPAIVVPLLAGGLERALITAEVLETRGFGGSPTRSGCSILASLRLLGGLIAIAAGAYCLLAGQTAIGGLCGGVGIILLVVEIRRKSQTVMPTRLRDEPWTRFDTVTLIASGIAAAIVVFRLATVTAGFDFAAYPVLRAPVSDILVMAGLLLLFAPALSPANIAS